ncbi:MAG: tRNA lysidine(34) synthetase TilS [Actinomycetota bacterium]
MNATQLCGVVRETMRKRDMIPTGTILAAVSGGADSLTLMHALHRLGFDVEVAHFDHRVRKGSEKDLELVKREASKLKLRVHSGSRESQMRAGESPEAWLRRERLDFLDQTVRAIDAACIATGHTKSDQSETVMMRFVSGSGRAGLSGIPPKRGMYIRPLIDITRTDTEAFCRSLRLKPVTDPTNLDVAFRRNAVRHELLPFVRAGFNASIDDALARSADIARDEDSLLDQLASEAIEVDASAGSVRFSIESFRELHPALQRRTIRRLAPLGATHTEQVRNLALNASSGDQISLPLGSCARVEYGWLVLGPAPSTTIAGSGPIPLEVPGVSELPEWGAQLRATVMSNKQHPFPDARTSCAVDEATVGEAMVVRAPRSGDVFRPFGMRTSKKLSNFFSDEKIPRDDRTRTPIVAGAKGIVWVVGHRIDDRHKVTQKTRRVLVMEWLQ